MDLDGDGHDDVISGSYWPGDVYWFRGLGDGKYAAGETLEDAGGKPLNAGAPWTSEEEPEMDSLAAAPFAVDWDGDGDLDMLVGNIAGRVILIENEGSATEMAFHADRRTPLEAGGEVISVNHGDAGPVMVDWDGDDLLDLLVGAGDGSIMFYRNEGEPGAPRLAVGVALLEGREDDDAIPRDQSPKLPGTRTKIHVVDYDCDGKLDLLVGDYSSVEGEEPDLTDEQLARRDELRAKSEALEAEIETKIEALGSESEEFEAWMDTWSERMGEVMEELWELETYPDPAGFVWFLRRSE